MKHKCSNPKCDGELKPNLGNRTYCQYLTHRKVMYRKHHKDPISVRLLKIAEIVLVSKRKMLELKKKEIIEACIKANPNRVESWVYDSGEPVGSGYIKKSPCRLADVLSAINQTEDGRAFIREDGGIYSDNEKALDIHYMGVFWNLKDDNLENQSEGTINFIHNILFKKHG